MSSFTYLCFLLLCIARIDALTSDYLHGPIKISNEGRVWYSGNVGAAEVDIGLSLSLQPSANAMWVGLGIAAPGSAGMRGADLFTAQYPAANGNGNSIRNITNCTVVQARSAPFIGTSRIGLSADIVAPTLPGLPHGWKFRACSRNTNGIFSLEITRKMNSTASEEYIDTTTSFLLAYGSGETVSYHAKTKFSTALNFFRAPAPAHRLPSDHSGTFSFKSPKFASTDATLTCWTGIFAPGEPAKMVIAMEAEVKSGAPGISRLMVYGCRPSPYFSPANFAKLENKCSSEAYSVGVDPEARCGTLFYSWAPGVGRLSFPEEAGIFLSALNRQILVEVTFNTTTTGGRGSRLDDIELKFHYTDTVRKFRVGTMAAGDAAHRWVSRPTLNITTTCTSRCTQYLKEPINIFAVHMHLGRYGRRAELAIRRKETPDVFSEVDSVPYWASGYERYSNFSRAPVVFTPGDALALTCNYKLDRYVITPERFRNRIYYLPYGRRVDSEQCDAWLHYYPAQYRFDPDEDGDLFYCAQRYNDAGAAAMICGAGWRGRQAMVQFEENEVVCFPALSKVTIRDADTSNTTEIFMKDLIVGDEVLVGASGQYSRVYMFTHADRYVRAKFVVLLFSDGSAFAASPGHLIYSAKGKLLRADEVAVGDTLDTLKPGHKVVSISTEERVGLYNPQTLQGDIVVNGVVASTYTSAVASTVSHALLSPARLLYSFLASDTSPLVCGEIGRGFLLRIRQLAMTVLSITGDLI